MTTREEDALSYPFRGLGQRKDSSPTYKRVSYFTGRGVERVLESSRFPHQKRDYGRVTRFIRHGVDKAFEQGEKNIYPNEKKHFRRVSYFRAPGIEKKEGNEGLPFSNPQKNFKRVNQLEREAIENNNAGNDEKVQRTRKKFISLERYPDGKPFIYGSDVTSKNTDEKDVKQKGHQQEAMAESQDKEPIKEQKKEFEIYHPWGGEYTGAPKVDKNGKLQVQLRGLQLERDPLGRRESDFDLFGQEKTWKKRKLDGVQKPEVKSKIPITKSEELDIQKQKERKSYYVQFLEKQMKERGHKDIEIEEDKATSYDWHKDVVERNLSGKLKPRKRLLFSLDYGTNDRVPDPEGYLTIVDKMGQPHQPGGVPKTGHLPETGQEFDFFHPWGRPGAGAPLLDESGKIKPTRSKKKSSNNQVEGTVPVDVSYKTKINPVTGQVMRSTSDNTPMQYRRAKPWWYLEQRKTPIYKKNYNSLQESKQNDSDGLRIANNIQRDLKVSEKEVGNNKEDKVVSVKEETNKQNPSQTRYEDSNKRLGGKELQEMEVITRKRKIDKKEEKELNKLCDIEHVLAWGRPGAGAPRVKKDGSVDALRKNDMMLRTQAMINSGWGFRRY